LKGTNGDALSRLIARVIEAKEMAARTRDRIAQSREMIAHGRTVAEQSKGSATRVREVVARVHAVRLLRSDTDDASLL
jgi:hypothetical protein